MFGVLWSWGGFVAALQVVWSFFVGLLRAGGIALLLFIGCLPFGCAFVGHITNNFPPGRNEAGLFHRSTTDVGVYSDTGDANKQEASSAMVGVAVTKPAEPAGMPDEPSPPPVVSEREPPPSPGATPRIP